MKERNFTNYDCLVVGSGASGSWAAKTLGENGFKVLVVEGGGAVSPSIWAEGRPFSADLKRIYRHLAGGRQFIQSSHGAYLKHHPDLFVDDKTHPYSSPDESSYRWIRSRHVGGRTLTWGGVTLRLSDFEFLGPEREGYGEPWPLTSSELSPFYDRVEEFMGVCGSIEGLPQLPDGKFLPSKEMTPGELILREIVEKRWSNTRLISGRGIPAFFDPHKPEGWPLFSAQATTLPAALGTGNVSILTNTIVSHVVVDPKNGNACALACVDRYSKVHFEIPSGMIVLAASTIETLRILLNSKSNHHPDGLGNSSGLLGKYLVDHPATESIIAKVGTLEPFFSPGGLQGPYSFHVPRFVNLPGTKRSFVGGFGLWGGVQRIKIDPGYEWLMKRLLSSPLKTFAEFFSDPRDFYRKASFKNDWLAEPRICLQGIGEMLPKASNRVTLNKTETDSWSIPTAHIECSYSENDICLVEAMYDSIGELLSELGAEIVVNGNAYKTKSPQRPGQYVHELGGARMGRDATSSVVNKYNRLWDSSNVLVTDGACWPSSGWQNPALTIMALTVRACEKWIEDNR